MNGTQSNARILSLFFSLPIKIHLPSSSHLQRSLTGDFRLQVFFMNQCPPGPQVFHWGRFEFCRKFAEIFANEYLSPVSTTPAINCSAVSTTPAKNLSPVSTTPAINPCHGEITKKPKRFRRCQRHRR